MKSSSDTSLLTRRRRAVELRLAGRTLLQIRQSTGLSVPTIIAAHKAYLAGGWPAVAVRAPGRPAGSGRTLSAAQDAELRAIVTCQAPAEGGLWTAEAVQQQTAERYAFRLSERSLARTLQRWAIASPSLRQAAQATAAGRAWAGERLPALLAQAHARGRTLVWCMQVGCSPDTRVLVAQTMKGRLAWLPIHAPADAGAWDDFLQRLHHALRRPLTALMPPATSAAGSPDVWIEPCPVAPRPKRPAPVTEPMPTTTPPRTPPRAPAQQGTSMKLTHLQRLEAESIHILREVVAECERPVMLYSIGKDSSVMLHLARKAFYPSPPPFPLLHVDTTWKFRDMYAMRDRMARELGMDLLVHRNPEAMALGINPFTHGSQIHTDMWKTQGLKQALDLHGFDAAFGGARRDEEKSRAKERIFSFRSTQHRWDPKGQRPELWQLYNARKHAGESIRVFPLSNWTELDVWQYIYLENIAIVPLYFASERPVVERDGMLIMVDDDRMPLKPGETPSLRRVRFRTLGCYPLTGAIESEADTLPAIIQEMLLTRTSERQGRLIDHDTSASMEKKKQEGYF
jgi:sulfate adenylyltransferase subunit 2